MDPEDVPLDLAVELGAAESAAIQCPTLYIPSQDRVGRAFDPARWVERALQLLSKIGGGATALPPVDGAWLNPETSQLISEKVVLAYTYVDPTRLRQHYPNCASSSTN